MEKGLTLRQKCDTILPVSERKNNEINKMNNEMKTEFKNQVRSLLSDDAMHYGNVQSNVEQALNEGWTVEECAKQCESDVWNKCLTFSLYLLNYFCYESYV